LNQSSLCEFFNMSPLRAVTLMRNKPEVLIMASDELLTEPLTVAEFNLHWVGVDEKVAARSK
jgi:hypothetical protein